MANDFSELKRSSQENLEKLRDSFNKKTFERDERYWRPKLDQAGNGSAIIRFLPAPRGEDDPFVSRITYSFKGPTGKWYIEPSPASIDLPDPAQELWSKYYNLGTEEGKKKAKILQRRFGYISNIYIVKHPANPEDEGKVFLFEYGKKIRDKMSAIMYPDEKLGEMPVNPFHIIEGANFTLKIKKKDNFPNYDDSAFGKQGPFASEDIMEKAWEATHSLLGEIAPNKFKSYDDLKKRLDLVMGFNTATPPKPGPDLETTESDSDGSLPWEESSSDDGEDTETMEYFNNLAKRRAG